jgi:hypothetical protein
MTLTAIYDIETNGLLTEKRERNGTVCPPMNKVHCLAMLLKDSSSGEVRRISATDHPYEGDEGWELMRLAPALQLLETADIRVAHNGQDFDERAIPLVYPWFRPKEGSSILDTLLLSRLIYPDINKSGPNSHKLMGHEKRMHSLAAWGSASGSTRETTAEGGPSGPRICRRYMEQDVEVLVRFAQVVDGPEAVPGEQRP